MWSASTSNSEISERKREYFEVRQNSAHVPRPLVLYADFESYLTFSGEHVPSCFCCLRVSKFPEHDHNIFTYSGDNVLQNFFQHIKQEQDTINNILSTNLAINTLTDEESRAHDAATACFICENEFTITNVKTKHHCHIFMHVQQAKV